MLELTEYSKGTNEINRMLTVDIILKRAMKGELNILDPAMKVAEELMEIPDFDYDDSGEYAAEKKNRCQL